MSDQAMRIPPLRITLMEGMIAVASCAMILALLRIEIIREFFAIAVGPVIGAVAHRALGGRGILGGMVGGVAVFWAFGALMYARAYLYPQPNTVDYLGPILSFSVLGFLGAGIGLTVGIFIWWLRIDASPGETGRVGSPDR